MNILKIVLSFVFAVVLFSSQAGISQNQQTKKTTVKKTKTTVKSGSVKPTSKKPTVPKPEKTPVGVELFNVNSSSAPCENNESKSCMLIRKNNEKEYEIFNEDIDGFVFEPGNEYVLWVKKQLKTPPITSTESIYKYVLVKIVSKNGIKLNNSKTIDALKDDKNKPEWVQEGTTTLVINEEQVPCENVEELNCLLIKKEGAKEFEIFYQQIEGFLFEKGYRQTILVHKRAVDNPQVKQAKPIYSFIKVLKKEKIFDASTTTPTTTTTTILPISSDATCPFDKKWYLKKMKADDSSAYEIVDRSVWIDINFAEKKLGGKAPCNTFMGGFTSDLKTTFVSDRPVSTKMYCDNMNLEVLFLSLLQNVDSYKQSSTTLDLYRGKVLLLSFER